MWGKFKKDKQIKPNQQKDYPMEDISLEELRRAIRKYSEQLPDKVPLSTIIKDDLRIDYQLLAPFLKAIPRQTYYMSRETYELFEEKDYQLALEVDMVQQGVDNYISQTNERPIIHGDPYKKISFHKLETLNLIQYRPNYSFYLTDEEDLITYQKPS